MNRSAGFYLGLVALALTLFSGHATAGTLCNTGFAAPVGNNAPLSGTITGGVVVKSGAICWISGANVSGGIQVNGGGVLIVCGSAINGGITANGAAEVILGAEELRCEGDLVNGVIKISDNGSGVFGPAPSVALENSTLNGGVHLSGNSGLVSVASNTILGGLFCDSTDSALIDEGRPSQVTGKLTCTFAEEE